MKLARVYEQFGAQTLSPQVFVGDEKKHMVSVQKPLMEILDQGSLIHVA